MPEGNQIPSGFLLFWIDSAFLIVFHPMKKYVCLILLASTFSTAYSQTGDWYINANGSKLTLSIAEQGSKTVAYISSGAACNEKLDNITFNGELLEFRRGSQWYRVSIADGVMIGRFAGSTGPRPPLSAYKYHVTGWSREYFSQIAPVVFDVIVNHRVKGRLRIDRLGDNFIGRLKFYALDNGLWEYPEEEITAIQWDGENLAFKRGTQNFYGTVDGNTISGKFAVVGGAGCPWRGTRAEVLTYGISPKSPEDRAEWQERTRRTLYRLMMAGNPAPLTTQVEVVRELLPLTGDPWKFRDDNPSAYPQNYTLTELRLTYTLPNWLGGDPIARVAHAYLAKPTTPPPGNLERYPLVVAVNGHAGSAYQTMMPGGHSWEGDAFARRGYMVLAVDIGHRPPSDLVQIGSTSDINNYLGNVGIAGPDSLPFGNDWHPSIKPAGFDAYYSDWEEDGERVWDVSRAIDYAIGRGDVDGNRIIVTGLSMGGEVTSYVGALDPRVAISIPAGFSPDLSVLKHLGVGCWNWGWANTRDYIDQSDLYALTAPRGLIVQTGILDNGFSQFPQWSFAGVPNGSAPFAADKQVMRRARAAGGPIVHYLHPLAHEWQSGVASGGLRYPVIIEPRSPDDLLWQVNSETATDGRTVFDYVRAWLGF